jgi:hypothetical protein
MRSHGVPNFPDSNSSGVWPKGQVEPAAGNPRVQTATRACGHLLPEAVEINPPRISTKMDECERVFPASLGIPPGA